MGLPETERVTPGFLCRIHGPVGCNFQFFCDRTIVGKNADADTCRHLPQVVSHLKRSRELLQKLLRNDSQLVSVAAVSEDNAEFIASQTADSVKVALTAGSTT